MTHNTREAALLKKLTLSYIIGFMLSLVLTCTAFVATMIYLVSDQTYRVEHLVAVLALLAVLQLVVQLLFFFHLGSEPKPRLNTMSFLFMIMVVVIIGFGSLWIMYNLSYNMTPRDVETYIQQEENIKLDKSD